MRSCLQIWMWWYPVSSPGHHSSPALCRWELELSFLMLSAGLSLAMPAVCVYTCTRTQLQVIFESLGTTHEQECLALSALLMSLYLPRPTSPLPFLWEAEESWELVYECRVPINPQCIGLPSVAAAAAAAKLLQLCLTLCDPIDSSPPGSSVPGIL